VGLVHDEILVTVPEEHAQAAHDLVDETMKEVGPRSSTSVYPKTNTSPLRLAPRYAPRGTRKSRMDEQADD
jgi:hypothetical protein